MSILMSLFALGGMAMAGVGTLTGASFIVDGIKEVDRKLEERQKDDDEFMYYLNILTLCEKENMEYRYGVDAIKEILETDNKNNIATKKDFRKIKDVERKYKIRQKNKEKYGQQKEKEIIEKVLEKNNPISMSYVATKEALKLGKEVTNLEYEGYFDEPETKKNKDS